MMVDMWKFFVLILVIFIKPCALKQPHIVMIVADDLVC